MTQSQKKFFHLFSQVSQTCYKASQQHNIKAYLKCNRNDNDQPSINFLSIFSPKMNANTMQILRVSFSWKGSFAIHCWIQWFNPFLPVCTFLQYCCLELNFWALLWCGIVDWRMKKEKSFCQKWNHNESCKNVHKLQVCSKASGNQEKKWHLSVYFLPSFLPWCLMSKSKWVGGLDSKSRWDAEKMPLLCDVNITVNKVNSFTNITCHAFGGWWWACKQSLL